MIIIIGSRNWVKPRPLEIHTLFIQIRRRDGMIRKKEECTMTRREFEVTDPAQIRRILEQSKVLHLGLVDRGQPYVVPMNYGFQMSRES